MRQGGDKVQEAQMVFHELADRHGQTAVLLCGLAVCAMSGGRWDDAERLLLDAQERGARDAETIVNLAVCAMHAHAGVDAMSAASQYVAQLRAAFPAHAFLERIAAFEAALDAAAARIAIA